MIRERLYLLHIVESVARIEEYTGGKRERFERDYLVQDAVIRKLQTIAESANRLPPEIRAEGETIEWQKIKGFRNILVHDYMELNLELIWNVVENFLPELDRFAREVLKRFPSPEA